VYTTLLFVIPSSIVLQANIHALAYHF